MSNAKFGRWNADGILAVIVSVFLWPAVGAAQTVNGQAAAVQATVFGLLGNTVLGRANTGTLSGPTDAGEASQLTGNLLGALTAEVPQATAIGLGDQVDSQASLANLALTIAGSNIGADLLIAQASAALHGVRSRSPSLTNLSLTGVPIAATRAPNQPPPLPRAPLHIHEHHSSPAAMVLHPLPVI